MIKPPARPSTPATRHPERGVENYYRLHARIYDATRWSFLFGRGAVIDRAAAVHPAPARILEVGCGTGKNLARLARRFPQAQITGVDLSEAMLAIAQRKTAPFGPRVTLQRRAYGSPVDAHRGHDLILCSYALSMFNPGYDSALAAAHGDLVPGGCFALVDFHTTRFRWFARWMRVNHVRMEGHLRPILRANFPPVVDELHSAYFGTWQYLSYVGRKAC